MFKTLSQKTSLLLLAFVVTGCLSKEVKHIPSYYGPQPSEQEQRQAALPDGSLYQGAFKDGLFHGKGKLTWSNGSWFEGEFKQGLFNGSGTLRTFSGDKYAGEFEDGSFSGEGTLEFSFGDIYAGEFKKDNPHGQGTYTGENGDVYSGEFVAGNFTGEGSITYKNGSTYQGRVEDWQHQGEGVFTLPTGKQYSGDFEEGEPKGHVTLKYENDDLYEGEMAGWDLFHGPGRYTLATGDTFEGEFDNGIEQGEFVVTTKTGDRYEGALSGWLYHGKGKLTSADGSEYTGDFEYGFFQGQGTLISPNDVPNKGTYTGQFEFGTFHGEGTLTYVDDESDETKTLSGQWHRGKFTGEDASAYAAEGIGQLNVEQLLYDQPKRMTQALEAVAPQRPGETDLYFIGFGSHSPQDVFMKDVEHSSQVMAQLYGTGERSLTLINNHQTLEQMPLATTTNLQIALNGIAEKMDIEEDILFLYLTSHGSEDHELSVDMEGVPLQHMPAKKLKQIIDNSGIKWKVILVSACYSGGFIDPLKDDHSLIITAASADRTSFGCSNDAELTYFGQAFFKDSLGQSDNFVQAFEMAKESVTQRELKEDYEPSQPQITQGSFIEAKLAELKTQSMVCDHTDTATEEIGQKTSACQ
ncbi:C13 family peptidase [Pseudomonadota bacterium]